jgi:hypothetical protein
MEHGEGAVGCRYGYPPARLLQHDTVGVDPAGRLVGSPGKPHSHPASIIGATRAPNDQQPGTVGRSCPARRSQAVTGQTVEDRCAYLDAGAPGRGRSSGRRQSLGPEPLSTRCPWRLRSRSGGQRATRRQTPAPPPRPAALPSSRRNTIAHGRRAPAMRAHPSVSAAAETIAQDRLEHAG